MKTCNVRVRESDYLTLKNLQDRFGCRSLTDTISKVLKDANMQGHYYSLSKDKWIPFEEMHENHLLNAAFKLSEEDPKRQEIFHYLNETLGYGIHTTMTKEEITAKIKEVTND